MQKNYPSLKYLATLYFILFGFVAFSQTTIYSEDFNAGLGGWTVTATGSGTGEWINGSNVAHSSGASSNYIYSQLYSGNYNNETFIMATSPTINTTSYSNITFQFDIWYKTEADWDGMKVEYSLNDGTTWSDLGNVSNTNWYNDTDVDAFKNREDGWSGNSGGWVTHSISLSSENIGFDNNSQVKIRILFASDNFITDIGVAFDNIIIKSDKYCPSYGTLTNSFTDVITNVQFNTIDNSSPSNDNGYSDFTGISTDVTQGTPYNLNVKVDTDGNVTYHIFAWIDWNQDGDFLDSGESYDLGTATNVTNGATSNSPLAITIPATASVGSTRMRVSTRYNTNPTSCGTDFDGEVEDYTINIIASRTITAGIISPTSYCEGSSISIPYTISGTYNAGNVFTAQLSDNGGSFAAPVNIGTLTSTTNGTIAATIPNGTATGTGYRIRVVSNDPAVTGTENITNLTVNTIPATPTIGTITQPTCATATGSVTLNGLPSGPWALTQSPDNITITGTGTSTTISNLAPETYAYTVIDANNGTGLMADYFNNMTLSGIPALTRTDATVNFNWGNGSPDPSSINTDNFSVRWSGQIQPLYSENYTFTTRSDDGIRLWINGTQIINNWTDHAPTNNTGTITLTAGVEYDIVLEFYENGGGAVSQLSWSSASQTNQIIPQSQLFTAPGCSSVASADVVINPQPANNTWNGSVNDDWNTPGNWCSGVPSVTNNADVLIPAGLTNYPIIYEGDPYGHVENNIEIESGATVKVINNYLEVHGNLVLNGNIDLQDESQIIQTTGSTLDAVSTGNIEIDQQGEGNRFRYNYWCMPVYTSNDINGYYTSISVALRDGTDPLSSGGTISYTSGYNGSLSPFTLSTTWMYKYTNSGAGYSAWNHIGSAGKIYVGQGFSMKGPGDPGSPDQNYVFTGKPNNGDISLPVSGNSEYLVGNPYPSVIDAYQFLWDNSPSGTGSITGAIYFWEHYGGNSHILREYQGGYATYNLSGGALAASAHPMVSSLGLAKKIPGPYIPVGQGFFVTADKDGGNIEFNNGQRVYSKEILGTSVFMKGSVQAKSIVTKDQRQKFKIGFEAPTIGYRQLLLTIDERATPNVDWGFDALLNDSFKNDMFWMLDGNKYVIQATNKINHKTEIPLGIKLAEDGITKIYIDKLENVSENISVYLKDKLTGEAYNITSKPAALQLSKGTYTDRFAIVFRFQKLIAEDIGSDIFIPENAQNANEGIQILMNNVNKGLLLKNNTNEEILSIEFYNYAGQLIKNWKTDSTKENISIPVTVSSGIYIVKVNTTKGFSTKKIIVN